MSAALVPPPAPAPTVTLLTFSRATGSELGKQNYFLILATTMSDDFRHDCIVSGVMWRSFNEDTSFGKNLGSQDVKHEWINTIINSYGQLINLDTSNGLEQLGHNYASNGCSSSGCTGQEIMSKKNKGNYKYCFKKIKLEDGLVVDGLVVYVFDVSPLRGPLFPMINQKLDSASSGWGTTTITFGFYVFQIMMGQLIFKQDNSVRQNGIGPWGLFPFTALYNYDMLLFSKMILEIPLTQEMTLLLGGTGAFARAKKMNVFCMNFLWQKTLLRCFQDVYQDKFLKNNNLQEGYLESIIILRQIYFCDIDDKTDMEFNWKIGLPNVGATEAPDTDAKYAHDVFDHFTTQFFKLRHIYTPPPEKDDNTYIISDLEAKSKYIPVPKTDGDYLNSKIEQAAADNTKYIFFVSQSAVVNGIRETMAQSLKAIGNKIADWCKTLKGRGTGTPNKNSVEWSKGIKKLVERYFSLPRQAPILSQIQKNVLVKNVYTIAKYTGDTSHVVVCEILRDISSDNEKGYGTHYFISLTNLYIILQNENDKDNVVLPYDEVTLRTLLSNMTVRLYLSERPLAARVLTNWPETKHRKMEYVIDKLNCLSQLYIGSGASGAAASGAGTSRAHECFFISYPDPQDDLKILKNKMISGLSTHMSTEIKTLVMSSNPASDDVARENFKTIIESLDYKTFLKERKIKEVKDCLEDLMKNQATNIIGEAENVNQLLTDPGKHWLGYLIPENLQNLSARQRSKCNVIGLPDVDKLKGFLDAYNTFPLLSQFASCLSTAFTFMDCDEVDRFFFEMFSTPSITFVGSSILINDNNQGPADSFSKVQYLLYNLGRVFQGNDNIYKTLYEILSQKISAKKKLAEYEDKLRFVSKFFENVVKIFRGYLGLNKDVLDDAENILRQKINNTGKNNSLDDVDKNVYKNMTGGEKRGLNEIIDPAGVPMPSAHHPGDGERKLLHRRRITHRPAPAAAAAGAVSMDVDAPDINKILNKIEERKNYGISYKAVLHARDNIELLINVCVNYNFGLETTTIKDKLNVIYNSTMKEAGACAAAAAGDDDGTAGDGDGGGDDDMDGTAAAAAGSAAAWYNYNKEDIIKSSFFRLCEGYYNYTENDDKEIAKFIVSIMYIIDADSFTANDGVAVSIKPTDEDTFEYKAIEYLNGLMTTEPGLLPDRLPGEDKKFLETALRSLLSIIISNKLEEEALGFESDEDKKQRQPENIYSRIQNVQLAAVADGTWEGAVQGQGEKKRQRVIGGGATQRIRRKHASKSERLKKKVSRKRKRKRKYTKRRGKLVKNIKASKRKRKRKKIYTR